MVSWSHRQSIFIDSTVFKYIIFILNCTDAYSVGRWARRRMFMRILLSRSVGSAPPNGRTMVGHDGKRPPSRMCASYGVVHTMMQRWRQATPHQARLLLGSYRNIVFLIFSSLPLPSPNMREDGIRSLEWISLIKVRIFLSPRLYFVWF